MIEPLERIHSTVISGMRDLDPRLLTFGGQGNTTYVQLDGCVYQVALLSPFKISVHVVRQNYLESAPQPFFEAFTATYQAAVDTYLRNVFKKGNEAYLPDDYKNRLFTLLREGA